LIFRFRRKKSRIFVLGLDGVPYSLVKKFCEQGLWKFFAQLSDSGRLVPMEVTLPEISAVSWPSFMSGTNPGEHGIFGFTDWKEGSYEIRYPNFSDLKVPTFWDRLGEKGKKSIVINQPGTYPARSIPGIIISGFVAIELTRSVQPLRYLAQLRRMNYQIDIDTHRCRTDHDQLFRELDYTLQKRKDALEYFWDELDWDYFQLVITGTDRLQHYLFDAIEDSAHPRHSQAIRYYQKVEELIKYAWELFFRGESTDREGDNFFLLSDHGFCLIKREIYLNAWLRQEGYLEFEREPPEEIGEIKKTSRAFALDPSRIYLHRKSRFPQGILSEAEADELRRELKEKLLGLEFEGEKVLRAVYLPEEVYSGSELNRAPDLILVSKPGFDLKGNIQKKEIFGNSDLTGMHTFDNAFFWAKEFDQEKAQITELAQVFEQKLFNPT